MGGVHGIEPWMVRILSRPGKVSGAGLLVSADHVLTCAHVVQDGSLAEFADAPDDEPVPVRVVSDAYVPLTDSQRGDIALLALNRSQPRRRTASLRQFPLDEVSTFRAYGFPPDNPIGVWAVTTLVGEAGPGGEWIQLDRAGGGAVRRGFSGSGVVADPYRQLVGMMVAADTEDEQSFMIPAATILRYLGDQPWITGESAIPADFARQPVARDPDPATLREISEFVRGPAGGNLREVVLGPDDSDRSAALRQAVRDHARYLRGIDLVVECAGRGLGQIVARIAGRAAVDPGELFTDRAPPMVIVLHRVDLSADPDRVLRQVIVPLSARHRILATFAAPESAVLASFRSVETSSGGPGELDATRERLARARLAERTAGSLHRRAALAIVDPPAMPTRYRELRAAFAELQDADREGRDIRGRAEALRSAADGATRSALAVRGELDRLLQRHAGLRARLTSYRQLAAEFGRAEDEELTALYRQAYGLLHDGPAGLDDAEAAVDAYAEGVRRWRP
ncbi:serine protease [Actinoplanes sp. NBRC 103695]|uniref:S1 family peptidase n=1 Tax=Actinoplanes sp. NBRC 103695 TaxID=3032202 RepID=UPI0024A54C25|nr:serine protease [Actinoplanes sp. NBRC 103695]GLY93269.1 serine protease [Actinoplanes sp. NBRC 103695]